MDEWHALRSFGTVPFSRPRKPVLTEQPFLPKDSAFSASVLTWVDKILIQFTGIGRLCIYMIRQGPITSVIAKLGA